MCASWLTDTFLSLSYFSNRSGAAADGQLGMMARMMSTFSNKEQSRFAAFKRSTLNGTVVQNWLAACIIHRAGGKEGNNLRIHQPSSSTSASKQKKQGDNSSSKKEPRTSNTTKKCSERIRPLSDLVVPGSHTEIGVVAATAAKIYAQRLVKAAIQIAGSGRDLSPEHLYQAVEERKQQGLDPGFFFLGQEESGLSWGEASSDATVSAGLISSRQDYDRRRLAAQAAQEAYDQVFSSEEDTEEAKSGADKADNTDKGEKPVSMEVS